MPSVIFCHTSLDRSISSRCVWLVLLSPCFIESPVFNANSVDPDQTPHHAASDQGLHTVCQCTFYETPGINGLRFCIHPYLHLLSVQRDSCKVTCIVMQNSESRVRFHARKPGAVLPTWRLLCQCLFFISPSFGASGWL